MDIDNKGQGELKYSTSADSSTAETDSADTNSTDTAADDNVAVGSNTLRISGSENLTDEVQTLQ